MSALTIRQKLNLIFAVLILVFVSVSIYSTYALNKINDGAMRIATTHLLSVLVAADNAKAMNQYRQLEYSIVTSPNLVSRSYAEKKAAKLADQIDISFDALEKSLQGNNDENFRSLRQGWSSYRSQLNNIIALANNNQAAQASSILDGSLNNRRPQRLHKRRNPRRPSRIRPNKIHPDCLGDSRHSDFRFYGILP